MVSFDIFVKGEEVFFQKKRPENRKVLIPLGGEVSFFENILNNVCRRSLFGVYIKMEKALGGEPFPQ